MYERSRSTVIVEDGTHALAFFGQLIATVRRECECTIKTSYQRTDRTHSVETVDYLTDAHYY